MMEDKFAACSEISPRAEGPSSGTKEGGLIVASRFHSVCIVPCKRKPTTLQLRSLGRDFAYKSVPSPISFTTFSTCHVANVMATIKDIVENVPCLSGKNQHLSFSSVLLRLTST